MTAAPPRRDSALDALGFAFGVLRKPGYLWAPMVLHPRLRRRRPSRAG